MTKAEEKLLEKAIGFQNKNFHSKALDILLRFEDKNKNVSYLKGLIASSYYQLDDFKKSAKYFKKTLKLKPSSEIASLGLFHSLIHSGKIKDAFLEVERFLNSYSPRLYKTLIKELFDNRNAFSKPYQIITIKKYYKKYISTSQVIRTASKQN